MAEVSELYDKSVKCPVCRNHFTTKKVRSSKLKLVKRDEDFLNYYQGENPIKYSVFVCPNCGYAAREPKFDSITENKIGIVLDNITPRWNKRDFGGERDFDKAIEAYKLALVTGMAIHASHLELGNICLHIGWLYRLKENSAEEKRFLTMARDNFIESYNRESFFDSNFNESKLTYLIGELSRRINDKEKAMIWLNTCIQLSSTKMNPIIDEMAREQWRKVKEM